MANATATINLNALGIQDMETAIYNGQATVAQVFAVVQARIDKRIAEKRPLLKPVVEYRNRLAADISGLPGQGHIAPIPVPTYPLQAKPNAALPTDPEQLADTIFATVGAANIGAVISRLTARVVGA